MQRSLTEQKKAFEARQECVRRNDAAYRLHSAAQDVIEVRNNPKAVAYELANKPSFRSQYPGGYDQVLATAFARYRAAGGTASSASAVTPIDNPCPPPALAIPSRPANEDTGRPPVSETRSLRVQ